MKKRFNLNVANPRSMAVRLAMVASFGACLLGAVVLVAAQGLAEVVITAPKATAPGTEVRSKTVSYADLDLSRSPGLTTLMGRIRGAASDVCSPQPDVRDIPRSRDFRQCVAHAVSTAVKTVNNPGLTTMVAGARH